MQRKRTIGAIVQQSAREIRTIGGFTPYDAPLRSIITTLMPSDTRGKPDVSSGFLIPLAAETTIAPMVQKSSPEERNGDDTTTTDNSWSTQEKPSDNKDPDDGEEQQSNKHESRTAHAPAGFFTGTTVYEEPNDLRYVGSDAPTHFSYRYTSEERRAMRIYRHGTRPRFPWVHRRSDDDTDDTVVITDAQFSRLAEHRHRIWQYVMLMSIRIPALVIGAWVAVAKDDLLLGVIIVSISIPVPWLAVLWANMLTREHKSTRRSLTQTPKKLPSATHTLIITAPETSSHKNSSESQTEGD